MAKDAEKIREKTSELINDIEFMLDRFRKISNIYLKDPKK
jgi:hypothetical protein